MEITEAKSIIFDAIRALNEEREDDEQVLLDSTTGLFGIDSTIDSLGLVSIIVDVETALSGRLGRQISLTNDDAMSREVMPFTSVGTLADFILELSKE